MLCYRFGAKEDGSIFVSANRYYDPERPGDRDNYGFYDYRVKPDERCFAPEINTGFVLHEAYPDSLVPVIRQDPKGVCTGSEGDEKWPLSFAVGGMETGNYRVTVLAHSTGEDTEACIYIGRRHLAWCGHVRRGDNCVVECIHNVSPIIPRYHTKATEDSSIDITVTGKGLHLTGVNIEKWEGLTIYIAGDSTVTDQTGSAPYIPERCYGGWGQMLSAYMGTKYAVSNHAHSGLTTASFRDEGHYDIMHELLREGDICLIQFGHNDQKLRELASDGGYRDNLCRYTDEIREMGAEPVIVTPLARNTWFGNKDGYNDLLKDYARVCREVADGKGVRLLDLHKRSMELITGLGRTEVKKFFFPDDYTHSNDYGAYLFAGYITAELFGKPQRSMKKWEPFPVLRNYRTLTETGPNADVLREWLGREPDRKDEHLKRYEALELVINLFGFFPTNVYNDLFTDVVGHEIYAGFVQCAYQNGILPDYMNTHEEFKPGEFITVRECADYIINGYRSRYGNDAVCEDMLNGFLADDVYITREQAAELAGSIITKGIK